MKKSYDLGALEWKVSGWMPFAWRFFRSMETGLSNQAEVLPVAAKLPGSVQLALQEAGILPDWNVGLQARECEWVENRHWVYEAALPDDWLEPGQRMRLRCLGLDYSGWILLNGQEIGPFRGSLTPHEFDLSAALQRHNNRLQIVFDCPPRWLGQIGYTSEMRDWKPRFNYTWDWTSRLVQIGIWDDLLFEVSDGEELQDLHTTAGITESGAGTLNVHGRVGGQRGDSILVVLEQEGAILRSEKFPLDRFSHGVRWQRLPIYPWQPNGLGTQPLYTLRCQLLDAESSLLDETACRIGFKDVDWTPCDGAPSGSDPWLCLVNGAPVFLQGVNWTPIRPNFADVTVEEYRQRLELYRDMGCNLLRVWGGAFLEKECFYDLCDELGLMVWQEFPLSSSGLDNCPPDDEQSIEELCAIAESYISRRQHHVSLTLWCGGNELQQGLDGSKQGSGKPLDRSHPLLRRLGLIVASEDPTRRYLATSSSGPRFTASEEEFGKGLHWDVHGPWSPTGAFPKDWTRYWEHDDALFRSETGAPGASSVDIIRAYKGGLPEMPGTEENPLWLRTSWWIEWPVFVEEHGREPANLEEYVEWSQNRQMQALTIAARACKDRFPFCGGFLVWMGHDSFPCTANTAIIDFWGRPKPAAEALAEVFREK